MDVAKAVAILVSILGFFLIIAIVWLVYKWKSSQLSRITGLSSTPPERKFTIYRGKVVPLQHEGQAGMQSIADSIRSGLSAVRPNRWLSSNTSLHTGDNALFQGPQTSRRIRPSSRYAHWTMSMPEDSAYHPTPPTMSKSHHSKDIESLQNQESRALNRYQYLMPRIYRPESRLQTNDSGQKASYPSSSPLTTSPISRHPPPFSSGAVDKPGTSGDETINPDTIASAHRSTIYPQSMLQPEQQHYETPLNGLEDSTQQDCIGRTFLDTPGTTSASSLGGAIAPVRPRPTTVSMYAPQSKFHVPVIPSDNVEPPWQHHSLSEKPAGSDGTIKSRPSSDQWKHLDNSPPGTFLPVESWIDRLPHHNSVEHEKVYSQIDGTASNSSVEMVESSSSISVAIAVPLQISTPGAAITVSTSRQSSGAGQAESISESNNTDAYHSTRQNPSEIEVAEQPSSHAAVDFSNSTPSVSRITTSSSLTSVSGEGFHTAMPSPVETLGAEDGTNDFHSSYS